MGYNVGIAEPNTSGQWVTVDVGDVITDVFRHVDTFEDGQQAMRELLDQEKAKYPSFVSQFDAAKLEVDQWNVYRGPDFGIRIPGVDDQYWCTWDVVFQMPSNPVIGLGDIFGGRNFV